MYISAPVHIFVAWSWVKHREKFYIRQSIGRILSQPGFKTLLMSLISQFVLLLPWLYGPSRTLLSFRIIFEASLSLAIFLQPLTPILFRSFETLSNHLLLGFPKEPYPEIFLYTIFTVLVSGLLSTCPNHRNLPFLSQFICRTFSSKALGWGRLLYDIMNGTSCMWGRWKLLLLLQYKISFL